MFGAIFAAVQTDMKRLLAYSSIENIGLIFTGIGLSILFETRNLHLFAALALTAALIHALNHSLFKSLLFLVTGSVLHATKTRNLGKLGGLIRRMPWVATLALVGTLSIAGLPPFNGFVSEWLLLQSFLFTPQIPACLYQYAHPAWSGGTGFDCRSGGLCDGEVLWRDLSWPAARSSPGERA